MAHDTTINSMSGGDSIVTYDLVAAGAYPTTGKVPASVVYVSPNANTAPTPVTPANPLPVGGTVAATQSGAWSFSVSTAIPAGDNVVGRVKLTDGTNIAAVTAAGAVKVDASATTQPVSGTVTANAGTGTFTVGGNVASGSADSGNPVKAGGVFNTGGITLTTGQRGDLQLDASGNLLVHLAAGSSGNAAASATGSAVPSSADYLGVNVGGTLRGQTGVNPSGSIYAGQVDLASVGGTSVAVGQHAMASSIPVVIASDQSAVPVSGTVTANAGTGNFSSNLAQVAGSSVQIAATGIQKVGISDSAGTSVTVGQKAMASSLPVAIASDQSSIPTAATLQAGTALAGQIVAPDQVNQIFNGTTALTPQFAAINASASGVTHLVSAVASKKVLVLKFSIVAAGAVNATFQSSGGSALTGPLPLGANGGIGGAYCPIGHFQSLSGEGLDINLGGATQVSGYLVYVQF